MPSQSIWAREPISVLTVAVLAVVNGGMQLLVAFGLAITPGQAAAVGAFVSAVIALGAILMRSQVSPTAVVAPALSAISDHMDNGELRKASNALDALTRKVDPKGTKSGSPDSLPPPPADLGAPPIEPAGPRAGMLRVAVAIATAWALLTGPAAVLSGCAGVSVLEVVQAVIAAASFANAALAQAGTFADAYFKLFPDKDKQAEITKALARAQASAAALAALGQGAVDVDRARYLAALEDFRNAYADLLNAIEGLPNAKVVPPGPAGHAMMAQVGGKLVVALPPASAFAAPPKGAR